MRRNMRRLTILAALCACALLPGCTQEPNGDPLAAYGADAALPLITGLPTDSPTPAMPTTSPAPTKPVHWSELPLDEDAVVARPTRRPRPASMDAQLNAFIAERLASERDNAGTIQANVTSPGMACVLESADGLQYLYFTADDGRLYRELLSDSANISWDPADAQLVSGDRACSLIVSLQGDLIYVCDGQLIQLAVGDGSQRTVLASFGRIECLTRWDDTLLFIAEKDGVSGVFSLDSDGVVELIIPGARAMQLDVVNRHLIVLSDSGLAAYSLTGDPVVPMIDGSITAFCYSGADLYYSISGAIYRLSAGGTVTRITDSGACWLGCARGSLFWLDAEGTLRRAALDGSNARSISSGAAFNPTLLDDRIAYALSSDSGLSADELY